MNANQIPIYAITPRNGVATLLAAAGAGALGVNTAAQTVYAAPTGVSFVGSRIESIIASTTDTAAVNLFLQIQKLSGAIVPVGQLNVPLSSGNAANILMTNLLNPAVCVGLPVDNNGKPYINLEPGDLLIVSTVAAMTAAKKCFVSFIGGDYQ